MTVQEAIVKLKNLIQNLNWNSPEKVNVVLRLLFKLHHQYPGFPYKNLLDEIQNLYPRQVNEHFGYRMDSRTLGEFGMYIYEGHLLERRIADWWLSRFASHHFGDGVTGECVGIDDTGTLLLQTASRDDMKRPDYLLKPMNVYLEIKSNPCDWKYTPKVADIQHYLGLNAYVLAVCSNGKFESGGSNCSCYFLISPEQSQRMLDEGTVVRGRKEAGGKPAVQFFWNLHEESVQYKKRFGGLDQTAKPLEDICEVHWLGRSATCAA